MLDETIRDYRDKRISEREYLRSAIDLASKVAKKDRGRDVPTLIVDVWTNDIAKNTIRNAIDDYFFDVVRDQAGIELPLDKLYDVELKIMDLARARFPG
jgi:type I restriction enzyme R subunit